MKRSDNRQVIDACFARLMEELGEHGRKAVRIIVEELGGLQIHMPSVRTLEIEARDAQIRREFDGSNYRELALKYGLDLRWVRKIIDEG
jgi:Mor family transcriptional regulator